VRDHEVGARAEDGAPESVAPCQQQVHPEQYEQRLPRDDHARRPAGDDSRDREDQYRCREQQQPSESFAGIEFHSFPDLGFGAKVDCLRLPSKRFSVNGDPFPANSRRFPVNGTG